MKNRLSKHLKNLKEKIFRDDTVDEQGKKTSLSEKAHESAFSGSSYNAKGNADHGKIRSNKKRR